MHGTMCFRGAWHPVCTEPDERRSTKRGWQQRKYALRRETPRLRLSAHAKKRMQQRCLSVRDVAYVVEYGQRHRCAGVIHCFLGRKDIPDLDHRHDTIRRLEGTTVLLETSEARLVTTVYRNKSALRRIRRKAKYNRKKTQCAVPPPITCGAR